MSLFLQGRGCLESLHVLDGARAEPGHGEGLPFALRVRSAVAGTSLRLAGVLFGLGCELVFT